MDEHICPLCGNSYDTDEEVQFCMEVDEKYTARVEDLGDYDTCDDLYDDYPEDEFH